MKTTFKQKVCLTLVTVVAALGAVSCACFIAGCAAAVPLTYGAERTLCVHQHDSGAEAARCMREVDAKYGTDAGTGH